MATQPTAPPPTRARSSLPGRPRVSAGKPVELAVEALEAEIDAELVAYSRKSSRASSGSASRISALPSHTAEDLGREN